MPCVLHSSFWLGRVEGSCLMNQACGFGILYHIIVLLLMLLMCAILHHQVILKLLAGVSSLLKGATVSLPDDRCTMPMLQCTANLRLHTPMQHMMM